MNKKAFLIFVLIFVFFNAKAQYYSTGEDPASLKWNQIKTANFQIIFPEEADSIGNVLANYLEYLYNYASNSLNYKPKPISVIIHTQTIKSNGLVVWTPKRMELYTNPSQDINPNTWLEELALHEFRHVVQIDKLNQGITAILYYVLGENITGGISAMVPLWLLEGDAVYAETVWSNSGRGRVAEFDMRLRALADFPKLKFDYDKLLMGSYKDYVPDHYQYGYQLTTYGRYKYGTDIWEKTLNYIAQNPYQIVPSYFAIKKFTGLSREDFFNETFHELTRKWKEFEKGIYVDSTYKMLGMGTKSYQTYNMVKFLNDSTLIAEKSSLNKIPEIVSLTFKEEESKIFNTGFYYNYNLNARKNQLVWSEYIRDERWQHRSFQDIKILDLDTKKVRRLSFRKNYFSPSLSTDARQIAAVENVSNHTCNLVVISTKNGAVLKTFKIPTGTFIQYPSWNDTDSAVVFSFVNRLGKGIAKIDFYSGEYSELVPASSYNVAKPILNNQGLFYISDYDGIDNVFLQKDEKLFKTTHVQYGLSDFDVLNNQIVFNNYTYEGFKIASDTIQFEKLKEFHVPENSRFNFINQIAQKDESIVSFDSLDFINYDIKKYSKIGHLVNVHSWAPLYYDIDEVMNGNFNVKPGLTVLSQNKLSTSIVTAAYEYDSLHIAHLNYSYKGWFPVIDLGLDYGDIPLIISDRDSTIFPNSELVNFSTYLRFSLPLNFTVDKWVTGMNASISARYSNMQFVPLNNNQYESGLVYIDTRFVFYKYLRMAAQDIYPRFGLNTELRNYSPFNNTSFSKNYYYYQTLYLPGLFENNSIVARFGILKQVSSKYLNYSFLPIIRGISRYQKSPEILKTMSVDYAAPLFYPDSHLGSLVYIKRIKAQVFLDYAEVSNQGLDALNHRIWFIDKFMSTGIELSANAHFFRSMFEINLGIRCIYQPYINEFSFEPVFSIDIPYY